MWPDENRRNINQEPDDKSNEEPSYAPVIAMIGLIVLIVTIRLLLPRCYRKLSALRRRGLNTEQDETVSPTNEQSEDIATTEL